MKRSFRVLLLSISALGATLFGLDKIGVTPIAPGHDVGFQWGERPSPVGSQLVLTTDAGDLNCWVSLRIPANVAAKTPIKAKLSTGRELTVAAMKDKDGWLVEIFDPAKDGSIRTKFLWPSGIELVVYSFGSADSSTTLLDWNVYLKDKESDSLSKALVAWYCQLLGQSMGHGQRSKSHSHRRHVSRG
jgi:hypothetical protein